MNRLNLDWISLESRPWLLGAAGFLFVLGLLILWWRRRPHDPEEAERRRRIQLNKIGRIVEGEILEINEMSPADATAVKAGGLFRRRAKQNGHTNGSRTLVLYSYSISGVSYQTAQDVTGMEERACISKLVSGQPASVKYDPSNPSNSILISDDWSGIH